MITERNNAMNKHKHYELAWRAHLNTSFSPEKRAETCCNEFYVRQAAFVEMGARPEAVEKLERLFVAWMNAKSRCLSPMITGPARFPVAKAKKANDSEMKHGQAYYEYFEKVEKAIKREKYYEAHPEARPISNSDSNALQRLRDKLTKMESERETNNAINKIVRRKPRAQATPEKLEELKKLGIDAALTAELFRPDSCGRFGVPAYVNQNLGGNIKRVKDRIAELERTSERETEETTLAGGVQFVTDTEAMRIYFEFDGKPDAEKRTLLKSNGFRWTPSQGHWGRKLTANAEYSAKKVAKTLNGN